MENLNHLNDTEAAASVSADDALFEALGKQKARKKKKIIRTVIIIIVVLAVVLFAAVSFLQRKVRNEFARNEDEVLSAQAERGTISTLVSGSGMLANVDTEVVSVPSGVEVTEILVKFGDSVKEGYLLAAVDMASVRTAMSELQSEIDELDEQISSAEDDTVSSYLSAGVGGRVKKIFAEKGMLVEDVMVDNGALALLSLDGYMAVDISGAALKESEAVSVILPDGKEVEGFVENILGDVSTILISDDGPGYMDEVTVKNSEGTVLGSGKLYIHNSLAVTGYAGKVRSVSISENQNVYSYTTLFYLEDTSTSASYDALLRQRKEAEETLLELLHIQRYSGLTAPIAGSVYAVADLDSDDSEDSTEEITDIVTLSPDISMSVTISVDEADILSLELEQQADVTVSSVSDETLSGIVTEIDKTASDGSYTAVITLDKLSGMLPGMTASVDVRIEGVDNAILIPADALHQSSQGYYVFTSYNEETQEYGGRVDVIPGLSNSNYVEIKSGLKEGDAVYYTESEDFSFMFGGMGFGGMGGNGGGMPGGSNMPSGFGGGNMPSGGNRPTGGEMPERDSMPAAGAMPPSFG